MSTLTLCKSTVFMMEPWKKVTVVKCRLISPSSSSPGGVLPNSKMMLFSLPLTLYHAYSTNNFLSWKALKLSRSLDKFPLCDHAEAVSARLEFVQHKKIIVCGLGLCRKEVFYIFLRLQKKTFRRCTLVEFFSLVMIMFFIQCPLSKIDKTREKPN